MKKTTRVGAFAVVVLISMVITACAEMSGTSNKVSVRKEELLAQAGFKTKTVTTEKQKQHLAALAPNKVSAVTYNGKLYYAYPDAAHNRIYVGRQPQYNAYRQLLGQRIAELGPNLGISEETAGPHRIVITQFEGWGPLGE
jgi:predicted small secreted protein